jgi:hypothetical protein
MQGDFFEKVPVQADCYVMKSILHDWTDSSCLAILRNLRAAMPAGSTLVNFDRLMPPFGHEGFHPAKPMDINMLVSTKCVVEQPLREALVMCVTDMGGCTT